MRTLALGFCFIALPACSSSSPATTPSGFGGDDATTTTGQSVTSSTGATLQSSTSTVGSTGTSSGGGGSNTSGVACTSGAAAVLPACAAPAAKMLDVPAGCTPTVDGAYHEGEWSDAACITVGTDPVYAKFSGDALYLAWPMTPACGCPAELAFNIDGAQTLDGMQLDLGIFDDPFSATGDSGEYTSTNGAWGAQMTGTSGGIVVANPPNTPALVTYEVSIPFSALGITAGQAHSVGLGISHNMNGVWPSGVTVVTGMLQPGNPSEWGQLTSSANWH